MDIVLHLGAHKTATTFVQRTIQNNGEILNSAGIFAPSLEDFRSVVTPGLGGKKDLSEFDDILKLMLPEEQDFAQSQVTKLIFSDENIMGFPGEIFANGTFYLDAVQRMKYLKKWLPVAPQKVVFAVRPYETFFASAYAQWLGPYAKKHGPKKKYIPREKICERILALRRGWPAIIRDIRKVFPDTLLSVSEYHSAPEFLTVIFEQILGTDAPKLKYNAKYFWNRGMSLKLVEQLEGQLIEGKANPESVAEIRKNRSKKPSDLAQNFWTDVQLDFLQNRYDRDIGTIKSMTDEGLIWVE